MIYFHYPRFCRKPQLELHEIPNSALHMLPLILQLLPDIPIVYDDDSYIPGLTRKNPFSKSSLVLSCLSNHNNNNNNAKNNNNNNNTTTTAAAAAVKWVWLVCCGAFFLMDVSQQRIYASDDIVELVYHFLHESGRSLAAADEMSYHGVKTASKGESYAPHAHLNLI